MNSSFLQVLSRFMGHGLIGLTTLILAYGLLESYRGSSHYQAEYLDSSNFTHHIAKDHLQLEKSYPLNLNWSYFKPQRNLDAAEVLKTPPDHWTKLDLLEAKPAEILSDHYWLRTQFDFKNTFTHPCLQLGLVSGSHRVYLNGHFIGGSSYTGILNYYPLSSEMLKESQSNSLLIEVFSPITVYPGVTPLESLGGIRIGELSQTESASLKNIFGFHFKRYLLFALSLLCFIGCLIYFMYNSERLEFCYLALFFACAALNYLTTFYSIFVGYHFQVYHFLIISLTGLSSVMLAISLFEAQRRTSLKIVQVFLGLSLIITNYALILAKPIRTFEIPEVQVFLFRLILSYTIIWMGLGLFSFFKNRQEHKISSPDSSYQFLLAMALLFSGFIASFYFLGESFNLPITDPSKELLKNIGLWYPILTAAFVFLIALQTSVWHFRLKTKTSKTNGLLAEISNIVFQSKNLEQDIEKIQNIICEFIGASRSTIYLFDHKSKRKALKARYVLGPSSQDFLVASSINPEKGVIGYVYRQGEPVLIEDISIDLRFTDLRERSIASNYSSKSSMIFPLYVNQELEGYMTFADPLVQSTFTKKDFYLVHSVVKDIGLILSWVKSRRQNLSTQKRLRHLLLLQTASDKKQALQLKALISHLHTQFPEADLDEIFQASLILLNPKTDILENTSTQARKLATAVKTFLNQKASSTLNLNESILAVSFLISQEKEVLDEYDLIQFEVKESAFHFINHQKTNPVLEAS